MPRRCLLLLLPVFLLIACRDGREQYRDWSVYLGDKASTQYSSLSQINRGNVAGLEVAWTYRTGDKRGDRSQIQCNPIVVNGLLFATSPGLKVLALEATTGELVWSFDPFDHLEGEPSGVNRGVVYWESGEDRRILHCASNFIWAIKADTGELVSDFGDRGRVDMRLGLDREVGELFVSSRTPGIIYEDLLIQGSVVSEGPGASAPGHVRAYDIRTGELKWIFHTIPHPGEYGYETWPEDAWKRVGGANSWSGMTVDEERGLVFVPTGSPSFDFWGGDRHGQNLFGNTILALNAATGERVWHFQTVRHDLWDRDLPAPPNLVTVVREGKAIDAVAQITKSGHIFILNRETGEPLYPIEERSVPASDLNGESTCPTQPLPLKPPPFARQTIQEEDINKISPESENFVRQRLAEIRKGNQFVPPSTQGTLIFPGFDGGGEWGGAAYDPTSRMLYVNANEMPWILTMVDMRADENEPRSAGSALYSVQCGTCHGTEPVQIDATGRSPSLGEIKTNISLQLLTRSHVRQVMENGKGFMPSFSHLEETEKEAILGFLFADGKQGIEPPPEEQAGTAYTHTGYNRFVDQGGYPAVKPPWGTLNAIDLDRGDIEWQVPLGELPELTARGIPPTGTENYGGPVVTAGGLLFIAATKDEKFRAFDKMSGKLLWETNLPAGGYATPCTYEVNGRQYVVIAAGGGKMGTKSGDAFVAFALPD